MNAEGFIIVHKVTGDRLNNKIYSTIGKAKQGLNAHCWRKRHWSEYNFYRLKTEDAPCFDGAKYLADWIKRLDDYSLKRELDYNKDDPHEKGYCDLIWAEMQRRGVK